VREHPNPRIEDPKKVEARDANTYNGAAKVGDSIGQTSHPIDDSRRPTVPLNIKTQDKSVDKPAFFIETEGFDHHRTTTEISLAYGEKVRYYWDVPDLPDDAKLYLMIEDDNGEVGVERELSGKKGTEVWQNPIRKTKTWVLREERYDDKRDLGRIKVIPPPAQPD
jgi:hypothetical protein